MDPALFDGTISWRGSMVVFQDAGTGEFDADVQLDQTGDGIPDRTLRCSGMVGRGRFGMRCSEDDELSEIRLLFTGKAVVPDSGVVSLRKAGGRGYTETHALTFGFQATQQ